MKNSEPIEYKGIQYPGAYINLGSSIGYRLISVQSLLDKLEEDGLHEEEPPKAVTVTDNQIAYYVTDEAFLLPDNEIRKIVRIEYGEELSSVYTLKTIRELKKGEFFRLKESDTAPVWIRGNYIPEAKKFTTYKFDDVNHEHLLKGDIRVFIGFTF